MSIAETAIPYAILALHDDGLEVSSENITKMLKSANIEVEPIWIQVFVKAFGGKDLDKFLTAFSTSAGSGAAPAAAGAAPASTAAASEPAAAAAAKAEESDEDMGLDLFG